MSEGTARTDQPMPGDQFVGSGVSEEEVSGDRLMTGNEYVASGAPETKAEIDELMTGDEYVESLRDGRGVYIYGEKVEDVTTHPAFRNSVLSTRQLYDALHHPETRDKLTDVDQ